MFSLSLNKKICLILFSIILLISLASGFIGIVPYPSQITVGENASIDVITFNNTTVNFTTTLGNLNASSAMTNSLGNATLIINSTISGIATVNASVGSDYNTTNVTFLPDKPARIEINISQNPLVVGNTSIVILTLYDMYNNINSTAEVDINISIVDVLGKMSYSRNITRIPSNISELVIDNFNDHIEVNLTNDTNISSLQIFLKINSTLAGQINITANSNGVTNSTDITFIPAEVNDLIVYCEGDTCDRVVNQTVNLSVYAIDIYGNPVNGSTVNFTATPPDATEYNSPIEYNTLEFTPDTSTTFLDGYTSSVMFRTDKRAGDNNIYVSTGRVNKSYFITGFVDDASDLLLTHTPDVAYANNKDKYTLFGHIVDQYKNPILPTGMPIKEQVYFSTPMGSTLVPLNGFGIAKTPSGPTPYLETVYVEAIYYNQTGRTSIINNTNLSFVGGNLSKFNMYSNPEMVLSQKDKNGLILRGNHESLIILTALDEWGHPISGINVTLNNTNTTLGNLTFAGKNEANLINNVTDKNGKIYALFKSNDTGGNATIIASNDSINGSVTIGIRDSTFLSVNITYYPDNITSGDIVNVTTIISVEGELPITRPAASAMLVLDRSGSMDPDYYAGAPLDIVLVNDISGSMDTDYMHKYYYTDIYGADGFTPYDYYLSSYVSNGSWWNDTFVVDKSPLNDFNIQLLWDSGYSDLRLQLISPTGRIYGYNGNASSSVYDYYDYTYTSKKEAIWIDYNATYPYPFWPDTDTIENGIWKVKVFGNFSSGIKNFTIATKIERLSAVKIASKEFNKNMISNDRVGLISFGGSDFMERIYQENLTYNISLINEKINAQWAYGGTPTAKAIRKAKELLSNNPRLDARPYIILLSDGEPTIGITGNAVTDAINEATNAKNTFINGIGIKIYTIGIGTDTSGNATLLSIASPGGYYYAASTSDLQIIYNNIAQQISDFDIATRQYGVDGFTPYNYAANGSVDSGIWSDIIFLNDSVTDFKVSIDNPDLTFNITSPDCPDCTTYPDTAESGYINRSGYYNSSKGKYIWISPESGKYNPTNDNNYTIQTGNWTINVTGSGQFNITTFIDKKSAVKAASHAFISGFNFEIDKAGLVLYSDFSDLNRNFQTSYIGNKSMWFGYFKVVTDGIYFFNLSWNDSSNLNISLYNGAVILNSSINSSNPKEVSALIFAGLEYHLVISRDEVLENDTQFTVNVSSSPVIMSSYNAMTTYYQSSGSNTQKPRYRNWDGSQWLSEASANSVGGMLIWTVMQSSPKRDEIILGTLDDNKDINVQIWDGSAWGAAEELSTNENSTSTRGFDIAYEQISGDAMVVYNKNNYVPKYRFWNGSAWGDEAFVNATDGGNGYIKWIRLISKPDSDEILLAYLDSENDLRTQIWNGLTWMSVNKLTTTVQTSDYQSFDVVYEQGTGNAKVVWSDTDNINYSTWNGSFWNTNAINIFKDTDHPYWIKLASDPNSNNILMSEQNSVKDIYVSAWNGSSWSSKLKIEDDTDSINKRIMDVAFEGISGKGLVVWGDKTTTPKYKTWNNSSWSLVDLSASNHGGDDTRWVQLSSDPLSNNIFLMTSDKNNDINIQQWNGSVWSSTTEVESSSSNDYESFDLAFKPKQKEQTIVETQVMWKEWRASVTSPLNNNTYIINSINTITAEGLTAIDEGMYEANNELSDVAGNSTIVLMTDGLDNTGYHSMLLEAQRAKNHNTTIYTIGLGANMSEIDPILSDIAIITGGDYYFAPNTSVLKSIFRGIAANITNFTARGPTLNLDVPYNYITEISMATVTYIDNSSNYTAGNSSNFIIPLAAYPNNNNTKHYEPKKTTIPSGHLTTLSWTNIPTLDPGDKWGVWYQLRVEGAGLVPLILPSSNITYIDLNGTFISVTIQMAPSTNVLGSNATVNPFELAELQLIADPPVVLVGQPSNIQINARNRDGFANFNVTLDANLGVLNSSDQYYSNMTYITHYVVNFQSNTAGKALIKVNGRNSISSIPGEVVIFVRPKGKISIS